MKYLFLTLFLFSCAKAQVLFHSHNQASAPACDVDAIAFNTAAGITDPTEQAAICQLATSLKAASLWTKMYAIYPFVGGTLVTNKWNLKDPRDLDVAFRLTWNGGVTFSNNGVQFPMGGGASGGNSKFIPSVNATANSLSFSFYSRSNVAGAVEWDMGIQQVGKNTTMIIRYSDNNMYGVTDGGTQPGATVSDTRGLFTMSRNGATSIAIYRNSTSLASSSTTTTSNPSPQPVFVGAASTNTSGSASFGSSKECAFASIGQGLTAAEVSALYTIVQTFETALSRQM